MFSLKTISTFVKFCPTFLRCKKIYRVEVVYTMFQALEYIVIEKGN